MTDDDTKLAWTRVTELQARGTELLLELRAARRRARAWKALAKQTHEEAKTLAAEAGQLASDLDRAQSLADYYEYEYACMDRSPFDDVDE